MKITPEVAESIGFVKSKFNKPNEDLYTLEHSGGILFLTHFYLVKKDLAPLWVLEQTEVETVADMLMAMYKVGKLEVSCTK